jgi:GT2 family glycosyltransferase
MSEAKDILFSVVIPLFNKEELIGDTLRSVLAQKYQNFEVVVIDDGSTDQSASVVTAIAESEPRIRLIAQANAHVSAARNQGIRESKGDYVALLDADDLWKVNHLEELSLLARKFPGAGMLGTAYARRLAGRPDQAGLVRDLVGRRALVDDYFATAVDYQFIYTSSIAIRKDVFDAVGAFDEKDKLFSEDLALWARVAARYRVAYSGNVTVIYNCDVPGQATSGGRVQRGLSPRLGVTFKEILLDGASLIVPKRSIQEYGDQLIYRRLMLFLLEKPAALVGLRAYAEGMQVLNWGKSVLLRSIVKMPIPALWRAVYFMRRCKNHLRARFPVLGRTFKCRIIYRNET